MAKKRITQLPTLPNPQGNEWLAVDDVNDLDTNGFPVTKKTTNTATADIQSITRADLLALQTGNTMSVGRFYLITNAVGNTMQLLTQAVAGNMLDETASRASNGENYKYDLTTDTAVLISNPIALGASNQLLGVNNAGTAQEYKTLSGTPDQITITEGVGTKTFSLPQDIATDSEVEFEHLTLTAPEKFTAPHQGYMMGDSLTEFGYYATLETLLGSGWDLVNKGISGQTTAQMRARFQVDVLNPGDAEYVIIWGGVNDIFAGSAAVTIENNLQAMYNLAHEAGLKVIAVNITPFKGSAGWTAPGLVIQTAVNTWIASDAKNVDYKIDAYTALNDPGNPGQLLPIYDDGGHLHLTPAGNVVVGTLIYNNSTWTPILGGALEVNGESVFESDVTINTKVNMNTGGSYSFDNGSGVNDVRLYRGGAGILSQRNGTNAQVFRVANTFNSPSIRENFFIDWQRVANVCVIGTEQLTGTARQVSMEVGGVRRMDWDINGNVGINNTTPASTLPTGYTALNGKLLSIQSFAPSTWVGIQIKNSDNTAGLDSWLDPTGVHYIDSRRNSSSGSSVIFRIRTLGTPQEVLRLLGSTTVQVVNNLNVIGVLSLGASSNAVTASVATPSTHKVAISINSVTYYLLASNV